RHAAARVVEIAKHDRVRRTRLLARRLNLAVADRPIVLYRFDSRAVDPLHAVRALLHHAAAADADVGIASKLQARRVPVLVEEKIESPYLVRAVVRAVPRPDTAVVHHVVQP